jgi:hypothetical protein
MDELKYLDQKMAHIAEDDLGAPMSLISDAWWAIEATGRRPDRREFLAELERAADAYLADPTGYQFNRI